MSRIKAAFEKRLADGQKAFIPFITAGDPSLDATERFVYILEQAGSDLIELGIPFSDPVADGPVIQRADLRAMDQVTIEGIFGMVERIRKNSEIALVFLMYANTIFHYGIEPFFERCAQTGVDGVIIPDIPLEERAEFSVPANKHHIDLVALVAPTSCERIRDIAREASGFLYCVSSLGVTGKRDDFTTDLNSMFQSVKKECPIPTAIGFGVSTPEQAVKMKQYADGVIVGSALVELIEQHGEDAGDAVKAFAESFRAVL